MNQRRVAVYIHLLPLTAVGLWLLLQGEFPQRPQPDSKQPRLEGPGPRLISMENIPAPEGTLCEWTPASATERIFLRQEPSSGSRVGGPSHLSRAPLRVIRDSYPTYSSVAVDPIREELLLQDENLFQILVYDRMANTPPGASITEPKRIIGGNQTKVEFNCALYVDPGSGDIYSVNNDTVDAMAIFSREARGNVPPSRLLRTPHGTYGIAVDEKDAELFLTVEHTNAVVVYRKTAKDEDPPLRILQGGRTALEDPHGVAVNTREQLIYVANHGNALDPQGGSGRFEPPSITVYPLKASGNTAPLRTIEGPKTLLNWPAGIYLDEERQELFVANDGADSILVFRASDDGEVAPIRNIQGPKTGIKNPTGVFVDTINQEVFVSNMGNHTATVYPRTAQGNVAPLRTVRGAPRGKVALAIGNPGAAGYDSKREEILVPN
ncbi:MAG: beta-propeller fold lactonase family protein [Acidobacteria bacterium]|nr:beta-propeller fold lactonase family protein [Acidobacteriota bacterium]